MKLTANIIAIFALAISALHAADPVVIVQSATSVTVNGDDYGKPADAIANNKQLAPLIQTALEAWAAKLEADKADAIAEHAALKTRINTVLNGMLTEELKTGDGPKAELLRKLIAESQKTEKQIKLETLQAEIAAKQKEAAELAK